MKLKNNEIIALVNAGLLNTTEHDVPAADAYKSYKFRKAVDKAFNAIVEKDRELPKTAGVENGKEPTEEQLRQMGKRPQSEPLGNPIGFEARTITGNGGYILKAKADSLQPIGSAILGLVLLNDSNRVSPVFVDSIALLRTHKSNE